MADQTAVTARIRRWLVPLLLAVWIGLTLVGIASLGFSHLAALPGPEEARLSQAMLSLRQTPKQAPLLVNIISAGCSCTDSLFRHLLKRGPKTPDEQILFIGQDAVRARQARSRGYIYQELSAETLKARFGLEAAPVLISFDAKGRLNYAGGYFDHPSAKFPREERILASLSRGEATQPLPIFGCAVSAELRRQVDPLGLVY